MTGNMRQSYSSLGGRTGLNAQTAHSDVTVTTLLDRTPQPMVRQVLHQGRVALGDCSPRAPTDPCVHTLAHTVPLMMDSPRSKLQARSAILGRDGDT